MERELLCLGIYLHGKLARRGHNKGACAFRPFLSGNDKPVVNSGYKDSRLTRTSLRLYYNILARYRLRQGLLLHGSAFFKTRILNAKQHLFM